MNKPDTGAVIGIIYFMIIIALVIHASYSGQIVKDRVVSTELAIKQCKFEISQKEKRLDTLENRQYELLEMIKRSK